VLLVAVLAGAAHADGDAGADAPAPPKRLQSWEWMTVGNCEPLRDEVMHDIEELTRIRFRRPVPVEILPKATWEARAKQGGFIGHFTTRSPAYYSPGANVITFVPWVFEFLDTEEGWRERLRHIMHHELTHALHHQNFWTEVGNYAASMKSSGLTEDEIDGATVDFLVAEGFAELVTYQLGLRRVKELRDQQRDRIETIDDVPGLETGRPERRPRPTAEYMKLYRPAGDKPFRNLLFDNGYRDGLTCLYHLMLGGGMRAVRSTLYRSPSRLLLFAPDVLSGVDLDDPPEPDAVFRFLHPGALSADGILLAVNPGPGRFFSAASRGRAAGCLLGYAARASEGGDAAAEYAFFLADPDRPGSWEQEQLASLTALGRGGTRARPKRVRLPVTHKEHAEVTVVRTNDGQYVHGALDGIVVILHEPEPTATAEDRVLHALEVLLRKRPKPGVFQEAERTARARLGG